MTSPVRWNLWDRCRSWYYRQFYWSEQQRADYALDNVLPAHPHLRAIEDRIKSIQAKPSPPEGSFEAWDRSEAISSLTSSYEAKRSELERALLGHTEVDSAEADPAEPYTPAGVACDMILGETDEESMRRVASMNPKVIEELIDTPISVDRAPSLFSTEEETADSVPQAAQVGNRTSEVDPHLDDASKGLPRTVQKFSFQKWQNFLLEFDAHITFCDYAFTFQTSQPPKIDPAVQRVLDGHALDTAAAVFAIRGGAVFGWWLDDYHNYLTIAMTETEGAHCNHLAVISLGQDSASPSTASGADVTDTQALLNDYVERKSRPPSGTLQAKRARLLKKLSDLVGSSKSRKD